MLSNASSCQPNFWLYSQNSLAHPLQKIVQIVTGYMPGRKSQTQSTTKEMSCHRTDLDVCEIPSSSHAWFPPFRCRSAVGGQPISVLVTSSLCKRKDVSSIFPFSPATATVATERKNGNGMVETRHYPLVKSAQAGDNLAGSTAVSHRCGIRHGVINRLLITPWYP